ncbi:hypothetical protein TNCV_3211141 [Trichonephila clavipes]|uniref:Uncharacterized protein n=1 Tax=Trichonephila clavipes TaxID=2585209 RepID=A0A8X6RZA0_TRICX|nr:hypothetical protein TNCV_3211141 [Trichonephila clavipes]
MRRWSKPDRPKCDEQRKRHGTKDTQEHVPQTTNARLKRARPMRRRANPTSALRTGTTDHAPTTGPQSAARHPTADPTTPARSEKYDARRRAPHPTAEPRAADGPPPTPPPAARRSRLGQPAKHDIETPRRRADPQSSFKCTANGDSLGSENAARSAEPTTAHNIFNHDSTANAICTPRTISADGRTTTTLTAVVGEDALKDDRRHSGPTASGKRADTREPRRTPRLEQEKVPLLDTHARQVESRNMKPHPIHKRPDARRPRTTKSLHAGTHTHTPQRTRRHGQDPKTIRKRQPPPSKIQRKPMTANTETPHR